MLRKKKYSLHIFYCIKTENNIILYLDSFQDAIDIINNNISKRDSGGKVRFINENRDKTEKALCKINKTILLFAQSHSNVFKKLQ